MARHDAPGAAGRNHARTGADACHHSSICSSRCCSSSSPYCIIIVRVVVGCLNQGLWAYCKTPRQAYVARTWAAINCQLPNELALLPLFLISIFLTCNIIISMMISLYKSSNMFVRHCPFNRAVQMVALQHKDDVACLRAGCVVSMGWAAAAPCPTRQDDLQTRWETLLRKRHGDTE